MKISLITPPSQNVEPWLPVFQSKGVDVLKNSIDPHCDFILCTGQAYIQGLEQFHNLYPSIPMINYTWDFYKTVWEKPNGYDWSKYLDYLHKCVELWCPSTEVVLRLKEEGIDTSKCSIIKTWARFFDYEGEITDKRYILNPLRPYVIDKNFGWLSRACSELQIPLVESNHKLSESQFQKVIAECSFICCEYHEASTGGLTLLEGYRLGKPAVVSDSPYMGACDYFGDKAIYFDDNSYEDFKNTIKRVWENTPRLDRNECIQFTNSIPSLENMVDTMISRLHALKN
tara:strand:+ start:945 stop:1802 length:858 start_codon:yes stop_codon:yes gene_type:complete